MSDLGRDAWPLVTRRRPVAALAAALTLAATLFLCATPTASAQDSTTAALQGAITRTLAQRSFVMVSDVHGRTLGSGTTYQAPDRIQTRPIRNPPGDLPATITIGQCLYREAKAFSGQFYLAFAGPEAQTLSPLQPLTRLQNPTDVTAQRSNGGIEYEFSMTGYLADRPDAPNAQTSAQAFVKGGLLRWVRTVTRFHDDVNSSTTSRWTLSKFGTAPAIRRPKHLVSPPAGVDAVDPGQLCTQ
jgi:hypothetical protein